MVGTGLTVVGWFATTIIGNIIDKACSVLGSNHDLQTEVEKRLTDLEKNSLPLLKATIEEASKSPIKNRGLIEWMDNLRNDAYKIRDALDDLEAKRFRESLKGKNKVTKFGYSTGKYLKTLIFSDKELKAFITAVDEFSRNFKQLPDFINLLREHRSNAFTENSNINRSPTSSFLDPDKKIFGRDLEIYFVLDIILNCQLVCFDQEMSNIDSSIGEQFFGMTMHGEGESSEVRRDRKGEETSTMKTSDGEQNSVSSKNWKLPVLPILGIGGVGKTTIAQKVYNHKIVENDFDFRVWVYVPEKFDVVTIMKTIVDTVRGGSSSSMDTITNLDSIKQIIESELIIAIRNKRYFLVLDDVPDGCESILNNDLFPVLGNGTAPGSFVLVTTQSERVAKIIGNMPNIISLDVLEQEWFDLLFKSYAFGEFFTFDRKSGSSLISCKDNPRKAHLNNLTEDKLSYLVSIATKIAEKLHGLPLAGRVIGQMLYNKLDKGHWEKTLESDHWDDKITEEIFKPLKIVYQGLDLDVQRCFQFCSIFPKQYAFDRNRLIQMWLAQDFDFVEPNDRERFKLKETNIKLEDIGGERFDKLVESSFFQETVNGGKYVVHDLIRELAIAVSPKQEFLYVKSLHSEIPCVSRHMGLNCDGSNREEINPIYSKLRTLILFGNWKNYTGELIRNIIVESKVLNLLDLSYVGLETIFRPTVTRGLHLTICKLRHLRYIDLSFSGIESIPNEFCDLLQLEVLDLRGCEFEKLPKDMNKLTKLRHLYANAETVSKISGIGKLTKLQELKEFRVGKKEGHKISELKDLKEISGHLTITNIENVSCKEEADECKLYDKRYLKSIELKLEGHSGVELEVLQALKPSDSVKMITISGGGGDSLPMWSNTNLKCIKVSDFSLTTLPAFGKLYSLKVLTFMGLRKLEMVGDEFYGNSAQIFSSLKELQFSNMGCWRTWSNAPHDFNFPRLKKITLDYCTELMEMPTNIFSSLVELKLSECRNINNIETILQDMPCLTHLSITECCNDLSICCTALGFLEVLCLGNVKNLCFVGGLLCLVNLKKLRIEGFNEIRESFVTRQTIGQTSHQNRILTSLNLDHSSLSKQNLPIAGWFGYLRSLLIRNSPVTEYTEEEECWFGQLTQNLDHSSLSTQNLPVLILTSLHLDHSSLSTQNLPITGRFIYLRSLLIRNSPVTEYTEEEESWFGQLTSLETLEFSGCKKLKYLPSTLPFLTKLKKLTIVDCPEISSLPEFGVPENLSSLQTLELSDCYYLRNLPSTLLLLTKLKKISINCCPMISSLPARLPPNLTELYITGCSNVLMHRCQPDHGADWRKISHIPHVQII